MSSGASDSHQLAICAAFQCTNVYREYEFTTCTYSSYQSITRKLQWSPSQLLVNTVLFVYNELVFTVNKSVSYVVSTKRSLSLGSQSYHDEVMYVSVLFSRRSGVVLCSNWKVRNNDIIAYHCL